MVTNAHRNMWTGGSKRIASASGLSQIRHVRGERRIPRQPRPRAAMTVDGLADSVAGTRYAAEGMQNVGR